MYGSPHMSNKINTLRILKSAKFYKLKRSSMLRTSRVGKMNQLSGFCSKKREVIQQNQQSRPQVLTLRSVNCSQLTISTKIVEIVEVEWGIEHGWCYEKSVICLYGRDYDFTVALGGSQLLLIFGKALVYVLHLLYPFLEFELVFTHSHLVFELFHDFTYVFELVKHLLVVASALGGRSSSDKPRKFFVKLHFSVLGVKYLIFFLEVIDFLWISMKMAQARSSSSIHEPALERF